MSAPVIAGVGMTAFGRHYDRNLKDLAREAVATALADAEVELDDIEAVFFANALAGVILGQECIRGETICYDLGMGNVSITNVENACASGGTALHLAAESVRSGQFTTVLALGAEKMCTADPALAFRALWGALDVELVPLPEPGEPLKRSPFIDVYAARARKLMDERGVTEYGLASVAAKAWANGARNPLAQRTVPRTIEEILGSRALVHPLTVDMCALTGDGAAAAIVTPGKRRGASSRDVTIAGSQVRGLSARPGDPSAAAAASTAAYEQAGVPSTDVTIAEVHDATAPGEMISWVGVGLCSPGEEEKWARSGHTDPTGPMPVNVSGGLMARGHPVGASGLGQVYELVRQLRGEASGTQAEVGKVALAHVGGGVIDGNTAVSAVHILTV